MKFGFQINLDVKDRPCIVVGGGDEATEKTNRLLDAGARVTVVSPKLSDELKVLAASARILHRGRRFKASDVDGGIWLVINTVLTDDVLSRDLYNLAKQKGFLLCSTDQPEYSTFTLPALVARGPLRIAISTSGVSPALAKRLREDLEPLFDERSEEHTSELQSPCISYAVFFLKKNTRLNSSHLVISYAAFCFKKKTS